MSKGLTFILYSAYGEDRVKPIYDTIESSGCRIEVYVTHVPGQNRMSHLLDRDCTGLLKLMEGELAIVHAPEGMTHEQFKEIVNPIEVSEIVDVFFPEARLKYKTKGRKVKS